MNTRDTAVAAFMSQILAHDAERQEAQNYGVPALKRLIVIAMKDTGQAITVRRFLLGLYNGPRFPFELTALRGLDKQLYYDCIAVLTMDARATIQEIHRYIKDGGIIFENWAKGIKND